jgi:hypothetical protein
MSKFVNGRHKDVYRNLVVLHMQNNRYSFFADLNKDPNSANEVRVSIRLYAQMTGKQARQTYRQVRVLTSIALAVVVVCRLFSQNCAIRRARPVRRGDFVEIIRAAGCDSERSQSARPHRPRAGRQRGPASLTGPHLTSFRPGRLGGGQYCLCGAAKQTFRRWRGCVKWSLTKHRLRIHLRLCALLRIAGTRLASRCHSGGPSAPPLARLSL